MERQAVVAALRRLAGDNRARRDHFRTAKAVKGELEKQGNAEAIARFDGDAELLDQLAEVLEQGGDVDEILERLAPA